MTMTPSITNIHTSPGFGFTRTSIRTSDSGAHPRPHSDGNTYHPRVSPTGSRDVSKCLLTIENENLKVSQAALSTLVEQLRQDKSECEAELTTLKGVTQVLHARLAAENSVEVTQLREVVAVLSEKLKAANESLALSTLDNFRRQQMCVSTGSQTVPDVAVAKMQNSPYLDRLQVHHLEVNDKMPWVQDLKMWYIYT
jgi:hypothetical protein